MCHRRIAYLDQVEALGRGGRTAGATVAGGKCCGDIIGPPAAESDQLQGARHVAHLAMQERTRPRLDPNLVAAAGHLERVERLQRRVRLAQPVAKSCKIVMVDEMASTFAHRLD